MIEAMAASSAGEVAGASEMAKAGGGEFKNKDFDPDKRFGEKQKVWGDDNPLRHKPFDPDKRIETEAVEQNGHEAKKTFDPDNAISRENPRTDVAKNQDSGDNEKGEGDSEKRKELEKVLDDYIKDIKDKSDCPDTIPDTPFTVDDLKNVSPEENAELRDEFDKVKADLKKEWEKEHGRPWPKYEKDVCSSNGKLIRKAGDDYDAHHIQPLGLGGKNEASNITPLRADVHYDSQGVHAADSPYKKLETLVKE